MQYEQVQGSDWGRTALYVAIGILVIVTGTIFLYGLNRVIGAILLLVLAGAVLAVLVTWHTKTYAYRCNNCGEEFEISAATNFLSPQGIGTKGGWKYLKCPRCNTRERAEVIKKVKQGGVR
ncbi:MAG: hypothetical protein ACXV4B_08615 [Halobacteriota archaeon]